MRKLKTLARRDYRILLNRNPLHRLIRKPVHYCLTLEANRSANLYSYLARPTQFETFQINPCI